MGLHQIGGAVKSKAQALVQVEVQATKEENSEGRDVTETATQHSPEAVRQSVASDGSPHGALKHVDEVAEGE